MKIAVSVTGTEKESAVDPRFGRAAGFLIYDTGTEIWEAVENRQAKDAAHGAGIQAAETVCRQGVEVVITGHVGPKAEAVLSGGGVKVYGGEGRSAAQAVEAYRAGELLELKDSSASH